MYIHSFVYVSLVQIRNALTKWLKETIKRDDSSRNSDEKLKRGGVRGRRHEPAACRQSSLKLAAS